MVGVTKINLIELEKVKELLDISKKDLESSEVLFSSRLYHSSVLMFQQSIEKTAKACALMGEILKFDQLKKEIGHDPLTMYKSEISKNLKNAENFKETLQKTPEFQEMPFVKDLNLDSYISKAKFVKQSLDSISKEDKIFSDDIYELDEGIKEMKSIINHVKDINLKELIDKNVEIFKKAYIYNIKSYIEIAEKQGTVISEEEKEQNLNISEENIRIIADNLRKNLVSVGITNALNSILSLFIMPHFDLVRYPEKKNPLEYYTEKNPLIMRFNQLIDIQKENLAFHREYLEIIERRYRDRIIIEK